MTKKKKAPAARKIDREDKWIFDQHQDQWGETLERFFEENEVGMDKVIHWNDAAVDEIILYNLMGWFDMDSLYPGTWRTMEEPKGVEALSYSKLVPSQYLSRSVYQSRGSFRYEEPGETGSAETEMSFFFNNLTNLGVRGIIKF